MAEAHHWVSVMSCTNYNNRSLVASHHLLYVSIFSIQIIYTITITIIYTYLLLFSGFGFIDVAVPL